MANRRDKNGSEMSFAEMREILASLVKQGQAHEALIEKNARKSEERFARLEAETEKNARKSEERFARLEAEMEKNARKSEERFARLEAQIEKNEQRAKKRDELLDRKFRALQEVVNFISEQTIALLDLQQQNELRFMEFDKFLIRVEEALSRLAAEQTELARKLKDLIDLDRSRRANGRDGKRR